MLTTWNYIGSDPLHHDLSPQGCPTQSIASKHNTGRWNLKNYAKRVLFKGDFAAFWVPKEVVEATNRVQNTLDSDQRCLFMSYVGSNANGPLHGHPRHPNCPQKGICWPFLTDLEPRFANGDTSSRRPPLSFLLILGVIVLHTHRYHPPKVRPNPKHHDGVVIFGHFARACCCCCLLLAAATKPGWSGLDTKEGYKTKTGFTSSVTLTLIKTTYWDRAWGGGGDISYGAG